MRVQGTTIFSNISIRPALSRGVNNSRKVAAKKGTWFKSMSLAILLSANNAFLRSQAVRISDILQEFSAPGISAASILLRINSEQNAALV